MKKLSIILVLLALSFLSYGCLGENEYSQLSDFKLGHLATTKSIVDIGTYTQKSFVFDAKYIFGEDIEEDAFLYCFLNNPIVFKKEKTDNYIVCTNSDYELIFVVKDVNEIATYAEICIMETYSLRGGDSDLSSSINYTESRKNFDPFLSNVQLCTMECIENRYLLTKQVVQTPTHD